MEHVSNAMGGARRERVDGRDYIVAPVSMVVTGVLPGSQGSLYYPPDEITRSVDAWNGMPVVMNHPYEMGSPVSARHPRILSKQGVGHIYNSGYKNNKLRAEAWIDIEKANRVDPNLVGNIERGNRIEVSTGLFTDNEPRTGVYNGRQFTHVARNYRPDHLAILPNERGACSNDDGCGINVNAELTDTTTVEGNQVRLLRQIANNTSTLGEGATQRPDTAPSPTPTKTKTPKSEDPKPATATESGSAEAATKIEQVSNVLAIVNAFKTGLPRSQVTGRLKPMGSGVGKGEIHEAAQAGSLHVTDDDKELASGVQDGEIPAWVSDEKTWERACEAGKGDKPMTVRIYQNMGGEVVRNANPEGCNQYKECGGTGDAELDKLIAEAREKVTPEQTAKAVQLAKDKFQKQKEVIDKEAERVKQKAKDDRLKTASKVADLYRKHGITGNSNPDGCNQHTGPDCGGGGKGETGADRLKKDHDDRTQAREDKEKESRTKHLEDAKYHSSNGDMWADRATRGSDSEKGEANGTASRAYQNAADSLRKSAALHYAHGLEDASKEDLAKAREMQAKSDKHLSSYKSWKSGVDKVKEGAAKAAKAAGSAMVKGAKAVGKGALDVAKEIVSDIRAAPHHGGPGLDLDAHQRRAEAHGKNPTKNPFTRNSNPEGCNQYKSCGGGEQQEKPLLTRVAKGITQALGLGKSAKQHADDAQKNRVHESKYSKMAEESEKAASEAGNSSMREFHLKEAEKFRSKAKEHKESARKSQRTSEHGGNLFGSKVMNALKWANRKTRS